MEEECNHGVEARDVGTESCAQSEHASQKGKSSEDQGNEVENPGEAGQEEEPVGTNKLLRDIALGAKVARRVEGVGRDKSTTVDIARAISAANAPVGPSRRIASTRDAVGACLKEIGQVGGSTSGSSGKDDEELKDDTASKESQGQKADERSYNGY